MQGWTNLTSFEFVHDPAEANGNIRIDDIVFTFVPEPTTGMLLLAASTVVFARRR
ncbi:MAG: PEP-CTERM sorting domain-containing protein [Planctomycetota bacterium]